MPKIKNIIIFLVIGAVFVSIYIFFIKSKAPEGTLVSSDTTPVAQNTGGENVNEKVAQNFLNLLLNVKNIKLNDAIFSDSAFISLHDSSITLTPDGTEGRINPFAPLSVDAVANVVATVPPVPPTCTPPKVLNTATNTCVNPSTN